MYGHEVHSISTVKLTRTQNLRLSSDNLIRDYLTNDKDMSVDPGTILRKLLYAATLTSPRKKYGASHVRGRRS